MISYEYIDIKLEIILLLIIGLINDYYLVRFGRVFFVSGFSFTGTNNSQDNRGKEGNIFASPLPISPTYGHSYFYCSLATEMSSLHFYSLWRNYQCATQFIPRWKLKLGSIIIAFYLAFFKVKSCPSNFSQTRGCFEFTSIITPVFQAKCMT